MEISLPNSRRVVPAALQRLIGSRLHWAGLLLVSGWPVLRWYAARMLDRSDEPLGLLALAAACCFVPRGQWTERLGWPWALAAAALVAAYAGACAAGAPILVCALFWVVAVALVFAPAGQVFAWSFLCVLSLPWLATVQFFLGYPLRLAVTWAAAGLLNLAGMHVQADATVLCWAGERVLIDAPCSGIQMAWTLAFVAAVLANARRLTAGETFRLLRQAGLLVFAANIMRAMALFLLELKVRVSGEWVHDTVGILLFAAAGGALLWLSRPVDRDGLPVSRNGTGSKSPPDRVAAFQEMRPWTREAVTPPSRLIVRKATNVFGGLLLLLPVAGAVLLVLGFTAWSAAPTYNDIAGKQDPAKFPGDFPGWGGCPLPDVRFPVALSARDARFVRGFPGRIEAFSDGRSSYVARWVARPTRKLHPASDCLRGAGYRITPGPAHRDQRGQLWSSFIASNRTERLQVEERISDANGASWTDVSAWYWSALLQRTTGPWWAVTRLTPLSQTLNHEPFNR